MVAVRDCVDRVVLFAEDTPLALIIRLAPDILVKGGDYQLDEIVGRDAVLAGGGRVGGLAFWSATRSPDSLTASVSGLDWRVVTGL